MSRWEPDARGRMTDAALDLFEEHGYEATTAADVAARAGVTERTFFRYFSDKREVLFDQTHALDRAIHAATLSAPADQEPFAAALIGLVAATPLIGERREHAVRRARIIVSAPGLQERELLKLSGLTRTIGDALRERGATESAAALAAHSTVAVFQVAFERWIASEETGAADLSALVADTAATLRDLI